MVTKVKALKPSAVRDLTQDVMSPVKQLYERVPANIELAFARGFQAGYEGAIYDNAKGKLAPERALKYLETTEAEKQLNYKLLLCRFMYVVWGSHPSFSRIGVSSEFSKKEQELLNDLYVEYDASQRKKGTI